MPKSDRAGRYDPRWHWLRQSLAKLYLELEPDQAYTTLTITTVDDDGMITAYTMGPESDEIARRIVTDFKAVLETYETASINANIPGIG